MAIALDTTASASATGDTVFFNVTVAEAGSIMLFFNSNSVGYGLYPTATIRFNGDDATFIREFSTGGRGMAAWYLVNPDVGTHQVSMAFNSNFDKCGAVAVYKKVKTSGQPDSSASDGSASEATWNLATTVVAGSAWLVAAWAGPAGASVSAGTTQRLTQDDTGTGTRLYLGDSNGGVLTGSRSLEYSVGGGSEWAGVIVSIAPGRSAAAQIITMD